MLFMEKDERTLLLVDDEPNILNTLKRLFRRDSYKILAAGSGQEGLDILENNRVDVIVSDQRMPAMTGVEFLRQARKKYPDTIRIILSGYTELQYITDAINEGAIYKFLTKPWDDDQLRANIEEAFHYKEMADENRRLSQQIQQANLELAQANRQLANMLEEKQMQIVRDEASLSIVREVLQYVPLPVIALDSEDVIVFINSFAEEIFSSRIQSLGCHIGSAIPELASAPEILPDGALNKVTIDGYEYGVRCRYMGEESKSRGKIYILLDS